MMRSLWTAASGMMAQQMNLDTVANNLANVNTPGFKKVRVGFQDLLYENLRPVEQSRTAITSESTSGTTVAPQAPLQVGHGVRVAATQRTLTPGPLEATGNSLDLAIDGQGFFRVRTGSGTDAIAYTRDGSFRLSPSDGGSASRLVTQDGYYVLNSEGNYIEIPSGAQEISISREGVVTAKVPGSQSLYACGTISLAIFANPAGLEAIGRNLFRQTAASGNATLTTPGQNNAGTLVQGYLERSNVQVVEEMVNLIVVQRAYEMNVKSVQSSDDILAMTNSMIRR